MSKRISKSQRARQQQISATTAASKRVARSIKASTGKDSQLHSLLLPITLWNGEVIGALVVDGAHIERALADVISACGLGDPAVRNAARAIVNLMFPNLLARIERYWFFELLAIPLFFTTARAALLGEDALQAWIDQLLDILERDLALGGGAKRFAAELASLPSVDFLRRTIEHRGTSAQGRRLRQLLSQIAKGTPGRPRKRAKNGRAQNVLRDYEDAYPYLLDLARQVAVLRQRRGFESDDDHIRSTFVAEGHDRRLIDAILATRTAGGASARLLAKKYRYKSGRVVAALVSRARRGQSAPRARTRRR